MISADAATPNQRYYKVGLPNSPVKLVGRLEVRDAESGVITSTDADYHDRGNQNRDDKSEESRALVEKIGANPDPLQIGTVQPIASNGIIWMLPNGDVIIGNHRVNGVRRAYEKGTAGDLEKFVREDAARRGIEIGADVKKPLMVFVLERIESPDGKADVHEVVRLANESQNRGFNIREQAGNDAKILADNNLLPRMEFRADGRIDETKSGDAIGKFRQESGAQGLIAEDGSLTEEGQTRIQNAALAVLLGGEGNNALLQKIMSNAARLDMQSELRALMKMTPELMALGVAKPGYDLRAPLAEALQLFTEWRDKDETARVEKGKTRHDWRETKDGRRVRGLSWEAYLSQGDMFRAPSDEAKILGDLFAKAESLRSFDREDVESAAGKKRVIDLISDYLADYIANARAVNTDTEDMFGGTPATRAEVMAAQRRAGGEDGGVRFSIVSLGGQDVAIVDDLEAAKNINPTMPSDVESYVLDHLETGIPMISGGTADINADTARHFAWSKVRGKYNKSRKMRKVRAQSAVVFRDLVAMFKADASTKQVDRHGKGEDIWRCRLPFGVPLYKNSSDSIVGGVVYDADVIIKDEGNGKYLYDVSNVKKNAALTQQLTAQAQVLFGGGTQAAGTAVSARAPTQGSVPNPTAAGKRFSVEVDYRISFDREDVESAAGKKRAIDLISDYLADYIANARAVNTETSDMFGGSPASRAEVMAAQRQAGGEGSGPRFSVVSDKQTLDRLNGETTVKVYRAMQYVDGVGLLPPMAAKVDGKWNSPAQIGDWLQADERPDLVKDGKFTLNKGNGASIKAAYNPYFHTSRSPLNDQFSSAYKRPNLVTVEVEVPESELKSGYRAEGAKDAVGEMSWHAGPVSSKLPAEKTRKVILSRWAKIVRVVHDSEVADRIAEMLDGEGISVPANTVTPSLRAELEKRGVRIEYTPEVIAQNIDELLKNFAAAKGKTTDEIFKTFSHGLLAVGQLPPNNNLPAELKVLDPTVRTSENYLLDHIYNHQHEKVYSEADVRRVLSLIGVNTEARIVRQRGSSSIAFVGANPGGGWDCIVVAPRRGQFYIFKTMFGQNRKPYQDKPMARFSVSGSSVRDNAVVSLLRGPLASIRDVDRTENIIPDFPDEGKRYSIAEKKNLRAAQRATGGADGGPRFSVSMRETLDPAAWGDFSRKVKVVSRASAPWKFRKGAKTAEAKKEITALAVENIKAQHNYVALPNENTPALQIGKVLFKIPTHNLFHGADRRLANNGPAAAVIGDVLNASVEVPNVEAPWHYRIAKINFGEPAFVLITAKESGGSEEIVEMQTLYSVNVKADATAQTVTSTGTGLAGTSGAARELNHTDTSRPTEVSISNLRAAWQGAFLQNLVKHNIDSVLKDKNAPVARQREAVIEKYKGTAEWLMAPNGVKSNLGEDQWVTVRTPAFKSWFGDWENDSTHASKIVDANGEPLVVYRGAQFDPLAQEPGKGVIKPEAYFTADPKYAGRYGKVQAYYLNIRNPFDIRRPECLADLKKIYPNHNFARGKSGALDWAEAATVDGEFLRDNFGDKYDGVIYDEGGDPGESGVSYRGISYVPLDGGVQVKSATDNTGAFSENPDIRYSLAPNPNLRADIAAALRKNTGGDDTTVQMKRHDEIVFSDNLPFFEFLGLPNVKVVTDVVKIRKFNIKHHLSEDQIAELPYRYNAPVAVMRDGTDGYVLLTELMAKDDHDNDKPVMVYLRRKGRPSGEVIFIATAFAKNAEDEAEYYGPLMKSGLLFADENKIAGLALGEETESILRTQASGDHVLTSSDYSWWSTRHSVSQNGVSAQGGNDIRYSVSKELTDAMRKREAMQSIPVEGKVQPWPENFPKVVLQTTLASVKQKWPELHQRAKAGSEGAALSLVRNILGEEPTATKKNPKWEKLRTLAAEHPRAIVAYVHAEEATGRNKIPAAYAAMIEMIAGLRNEPRIVQTVRAHHTGANAVERMTRRAAFDGPVRRGAEYILVDDHVTQGGTLNELRKYIQSRGGKIVAISTLTASQFSDTIAISSDAIKALHAKFGNNLDEEIKQAGIANGVAELTQSQARELLELRADTLRDRLAQARLDRHNELDAQAVRLASGSSVVSGATDLLPGLKAYQKPDGTFTETGTRWAKAKQFQRPIGRELNALIDECLLAGDMSPEETAATLDRLIAAVEATDEIKNSVLPNFRGDSALDDPTVMPVGPDGKKAFTPDRPRGRTTGTGCSRIRAGGT